MSLQYPNKMGVEKQEDVSTSGSDRTNGTTVPTEALYFENPKVSHIPISTHPVSVPYAEHGASVDRDATQPQPIPAHPDLWWPKIRERWQVYFSEFFGTFIMILFGDGVVAQVTLSKGKNGDYQSISWGE
jgi:hypothetical protein